MVSEGLIESSSNLGKGDLFLFKKNRTQETYMCKGEWMEQLGNDAVFSVDWMWKEESCKEMTAKERERLGRGQGHGKDKRECSELPVKC